MGIDFGTESVRVGIFTLAGHPVTFATHPYPTTFPRSGWAEQSPHDWWAALTHASRQAVAQSGLPKEAIAGVAADCTSCTVVSLDANFQPLRPALLWMDVRSAAQARAIAASGHPALKYNGYGNVSAEWFPCKALWLKQNEPADLRKRRLHGRVHRLADAAPHRPLGGQHRHRCHPRLLRP